MILGMKKFSNEKFERAQHYLEQRVFCAKSFVLYTCLPQYSYPVPDIDRGEGKLVSLLRPP